MLPDSCDQSIQESAVKNHILLCDSCSSGKFGSNNFSTLRKCNSQFHTKIHEALLIRKSSPYLNCQLYVIGTSVLLKIFLKSARFFIFCFK